jgi:hypothetical protein
MQKLLFGLFTALLTFSACTKDDDSNPGTGAELGGTTWRVTYYWDKDKDETDDFAGYTFEFRTDGTLVASLPGGTQQTGSWRLQDSNTELNLAITGTEPLDDFADDDWDVVERSATSLKLRDDSGSGGTEELHLVRI